MTEAPQSPIRGLHCSLAANLVSQSPQMYTGYFWHHVRFYGYLSIKSSSELSVHILYFGTGNYKCKVYICCYIGIALIIIPNNFDTKD